MPRTKPIAPVEGAIQYFAGTDCNIYMRNGKELVKVDSRKTYAAAVERAAWWQKRENDSVAQFNHRKSVNDHESKKEPQV